MSISGIIVLILVILVFTLPLLFGTKFHSWEERVQQKKQKKKENKDDYNI